MQSGPVNSSGQSRMARGPTEDSGTSQGTQGYRSSMVEKGPMDMCADVSLRLYRK